MGLDQRADRGMGILLIMDQLPFTEDAIRRYLDDAIRSWRRRRDTQAALTDSSAWMKVEDFATARSTHYVDAFQSVRSSIFGETLPVDDE